VQVKLLKSGCFVEAGQVLDVSPGIAEKMIREKRAEALPNHAQKQTLVPQRQTERMARRR
jgi:hypothetical protein